MKSLYSLTPICKERIWGSKNLANRMNIITDCEKPGEIFCVNALPDNDVLVDGSVPLSQFYLEHKLAFHLKCDTFPLRVNLIEAEEDLSIQVHPDDSYAKMYEHAKGLPEAWLVINSNEGHIRLGHRYENRVHLDTAIQEQKLLEGIPEKPVEKDMFFYLKPGTIHAIGKGTTLYEVTHMADITYRLYDYERMDMKTKKPRKLHIKKALENVYYPQMLTNSYPVHHYYDEHYERITFIDEPHLFTIEKLKVQDVCSLSLSDFCIITIISGYGRINHTKVEIGQTWLKLYDGSLLQFFGKMECIISTYKET